MLHRATHNGMDIIWKGERIKLQPGQFTAGRKQISKATGVNEYKVMRILIRMEIEQQITQQTSNITSLITITNWNKYQVDAQQNAQPVHNGCTTDAQPVHTIQEGKEGEEGKESIPVDELKLGLEKPKKQKKQPMLVDEEWILRCLGLPQYKHLDVRRIYETMAEWCISNSKQPTRGRFTTFLQNSIKNNFPLKPIISDQSPGAKYFGKTAV